jgi:hypothetical protein
MVRIRVTNLEKWNPARSSAEESRLDAKPDNQDSGKGPKEILTQSHEEGAVLVQELAERFLELWKGHLWILSVIGGLLH